jgi:tetratricopeptide (TPR) repeat protein
MAAFDKTFLAYLTARFKDAKPVDTEALVDSARAVAAIGDRNKSRELLRQAVRQDETSLPAHMMLAEWLRVAGDTAAWAETLERSIYIDPFQLPVHEQLATLYRALGDRAKLIRERKAIVALHPVDMAEAWYQLAVAQHEAGDSAGARQSVLRSLEDAPNFSKAQELLLTLVDGRKP